MNDSNDNSQNNNKRTTIAMKITRYKKRSIKNKKNKVIIYTTSLLENILSNKKYLIIILIAVILLALVISLSIILTINKKIENEGKFEEQVFIINTTVNKLSQYLMNSYQVYNSVSDYINSTDSVFSKSKIDIYPINESENNRNYYKKN